MTADGDLEALREWVIAPEREDDIDAQELLDRSPIRHELCWLTRWDRPQMTFLARSELGVVEVETRDVITLGIRYDRTDRIYDRVSVGMVESGLLIIGLWRLDQCPRRSGAELLPAISSGERAILATDEMGMSRPTLVGMACMPIWLPEELAGTWFVVWPSRFRVWQKRLMWGRNERFGVIYGAAALSGAVATWKEDDAA